MRAVLEELNAQGPPRDDLQFCRLLPQGDLHKLIVASKLGIFTLLNRPEYCTKA